MDDPGASCLEDPEFDEQSEKDSSILETETASKSDLASNVTDPDDFEYVLESLGQFGRFQRIIYFALWLPAASMAAGVYASVYMEFSPKFHCADAGITEFSRELENMTCSTPTAPSCSQWVYDTSVFTSTVVSQFNLVCDNSYLKTAATTVYMLGMLFGSFFFGWFGDKFGRKWAFFVTTMCLSIGSVCAALSPNIWMYMVARFVTSCGGVGIFITSFVLALEFVGPKYRTICGIAIEFPFAFGELYIVGLAYLIRDWQMYQLAIGLPFFLFLVYMLKIPESVRWLRMQGRHQEARNVLSRVAEFNNVILPNYPEDDIVEETEPVGLTSIFLQPTLRLRFVIMALNWIVATLGYYGLGLSSVSLSSDPFSSFALSATMEIPSYIFCLLCLDRFGRRGILAFSQILAGSTCILAALTPANLEMVRVVLTLIGKFGASASFAIVFVFTAELFPTPIRNSAIGLCSTSARVGAIFTPFIVSLSATNPLVLYLVLGISCAVGGVAALWLPETAGLPLPDTIEQALQVGRSQNKTFNLNLRTGQRLLADEKPVV